MDHMKRFQRFWFVVAPQGCLGLFQNDKFQILNQRFLVLLFGGLGYQKKLLNLKMYVYPDKVKDLFYIINK